MGILAFAASVIIRLAVSGEEKASDQHSTSRVGIEWQ